MKDLIAGIIIAGGLQIGCLVVLLVSAVMEPPEVAPSQDQSRSVAKRRTRRSSGLRVVRGAAEVDREKRAA